MLDTLLEKKTLDQHKLEYAIFLKLAFNSYRGEKCFNAVLQCASVHPNTSYSFSPTTCSCLCKYH